MPILSLRYKNNLLCIFSFKENSEHLTKNSTHVIIEHLSSYDVVSKIGVSSIKRNLEDIQEAIVESEQALGLALCKQSKIIRYDEMGINQLLFPFKSNKEFILFSDRIIEKIEGHDKSSKDTLLKTAKIYVKNNCNMRMTANQLEIHENSVRYRLNQIKECIDPNLSVYELDELLSIGFKIYFLNHKN